MKKFTEEESSDIRTGIIILVIGNIKDRHRHQRKGEGVASRQPDNGILRNRTGRAGRRHHSGSPARMATSGTRRNGHIPECRRIEATGGAECG